MKGGRELCVGSLPEKAKPSEPFALSLSKGCVLSQVEGQFHARLRQAQPERFFLNERQIPFATVSTKAETRLLVLPSASSSINIIHIV